MAFKKIFFLSLFVTALFISFGDASDKERPPRTLSWFSSSSSPSQVKTEQQLPQVQTPLPSVVPTVSTQSIQVPYVYNVRYYSDLSPSQDRSKDSVLVGQVEGSQVSGGAPCPYDHSTRVAGVGTGPKDRIAGYTYQYQTPTVVVPVPSPTVAVTPSQLPIQAQQAQPQAGSSAVVLPMVHHPHHHHHHEHEHEHQHQPVVVPAVVAPQTQQQSLPQIPGNFLPFFQAAAAASQHSHQHQGVVLPFYPVPQVTHPALVTPTQQPRPQLQEYQHLQQHYQQKVVPSVVGDYPYYYMYPDFVYIVPVLQQPQSSGPATTQQHQQGVPVLLTQRQQQPQSTMSVVGQQTSEDAHQRQQTKKKQ